MRRSLFCASEIARRWSIVTDSNHPVMSNIPLLFITFCWYSSDFHVRMTNNSKKLTYAKYVSTTTAGALHTTWVVQHVCQLWKWTSNWIVFSFIDDYYESLLPLLFTTFFSIHWGSFYLSAENTRRTMHLEPIQVYDKNSLSLLTFLQGILHDRRPPGGLQAADWSEERLDLLASLCGRIQSLPHAPEEPHLLYQQGHDLCVFLPQQI